MIKGTIYEARKKRIDYGKIKITERDLIVMKWVGEQYAVSLDHVGQLLSRESLRKEEILGKELSARAVRWVLTRWKNAGWVESQKMIIGQPPWVWLTAKGLKLVDLTFRYQTPSVAKLKHYWHVNAVRLYIEHRKRDNAQWICERNIHQRIKTRKGRHIVDGEILFQNTTIGTEVELEQKSRKRLRAILWGLKNEYEAVWYFASETCHSALVSAIESVDRQQETFVVYRLKDILP